MGVEQPRTRRGGSANGGLYGTQQAHLKDRHPFVVTSMLKVDESGPVIYRANHP
jgi:hypothetical protein